MNPSCLLEVICMSADDCAAAEQGGADRIELVSAIELGGLAPSLGTLEATKMVCRLPVMAMVRPRTGGFCYTSGEFLAMQQDARKFVAEGAEGLVTGILTSDSRVDAGRCRKLMEAVDRPIEWVFHRAFDITPDPFEALETLIELGFQRVLTSGQKKTAVDGADSIRKLIEAAAGRIEVLPGSGINAGNMKELLGLTGATQLHITAWTETPDPSTAGAEIPFNGRPALESSFRAVAAEGVRAARDEARRA